MRLKRSKANTVRPASPHARKPLPLHTPPTNPCSRPPFPDPARVPATHSPPAAPTVTFADHPGPGPNFSPRGPSPPKPDTRAALPAPHPPTRAPAPLPRPRFPPGSRRAFPSLPSLFPTPPNTFPSPQQAPRLQPRGPAGARGAGAPSTAAHACPWPEAPALVGASKKGVCGGRR